MKKNLGYIILTIFLLLLLLFSLIGNGKSGVLKDISYLDYKDYISSKDKRVIYIGNDDCSGCKVAKPLLENISVSYEIEISYLRLNKLNTDEVRELGLAIDKNATNITIPTVIIVEDGKVVDSVVGLQEKDDYLTFLAENNVISALKNITLPEYLALYNSKDLSLVYVGSPTCNYCVTYKPIVESVIKENKLTVYYLNKDKMSDEEKIAFMDSNEILYDGIMTPQILAVKDGKIIKQFTEYMEKDELVKALKKEGFIGEGNE